MRVRTRQLQTKTALDDTFLVHTQGLGSHEQQWMGNGNVTTPFTPEAVQVTTDEVTPNFKKRIAAGDIINNPYSSITTTEVFPQPMSYYHIYRDDNGDGVWCNEHNTFERYVHHHYGNFLPGSWPAHLSESSVTGYDKSSLETQAVIQAHANIDESEMYALATIAESGKSIESMTSILYRLYKVARSIRKLDVKALKREISKKELAERYMEARYAIRPLAYDAIGIARALEKKRRHIRRTYRGYSSFNGEHKEFIQDASCAWLTKMDYEQSVHISTSCRAGVLCDVEVDELSIWGADKLVETAWELVPFSFIIDWFANVGDVIAAYTPNAGVTQRASWVTTRETVRKTIKPVAFRSNAASWNSTTLSLNVGQTEGSWERLSLTRSVTPPLSPIPSVNLRLDGYKITDLGIILRKMFS